METRALHLADLAQLFRVEAPDLARLIEQYLEQDDPNPLEVPPTATEAAANDATPPTGDDDDDSDDDGDDSPTYREAPEGYISFDQHLREVRSAQRRRNRQKRRDGVAEAWRKYLAQDPSLLPPRLGLGDLFESLYDRGTASSRALLLAIADQAPLKYGLWRGLKRVYKRSEADHDAEVFGVLAARFDRSLAESGEVTDATVAYLRRRAWRFLRQLGAAVPEVYPRFAVQVLRHYTTETTFSTLWVGNHILAHGTRHYSMRSFYGSLPADLVKNRAYPDSWKHAADELMFLLETCGHNDVARFAIDSLQKDFPERLRKVTPAWLARLASRPLESAHEFLVETLQASPEFHQSKLRGLGLHDAVLALLKSPGKKARAYAIEYARGQARDMAVPQLLDLLENGSKEVIELAKALVTARPPRELGLPVLGQLLRFDATHDWASKALNESFERKEVQLPFLVDLLFSQDGDQHKWAKKYLESKYPGTELGAAFWTGLLDDPRASNSDDHNEDALEVAFKALRAYKPADIGAEWLVKALGRDETSEEAAKILEKATALPGLDVERIKGLVFLPARRDEALKVLGNTKLIGIKQLGLPWLLAMARRAETDVQEFARRYLLEHVKPSDFAEGDVKTGVQRLFALALGDEPEAVRQFAHTYLRCHHPELGPEQPESKQFDLKPGLHAADYDPEVIWHALFDNRADVRRFALSLVEPLLRKWNLQRRVYELTDSEAPEVRNLAFRALEGAGNEQADPASTLRLDELEAAPIFRMTESPRRATRAVAMELIRRHYGRLGGAERLGWLMQSADREVRLFAVRLLWEKHRPRSYPAGWKPRQAAAVPLEDGGRFGDLEALRGLLRRLLFGLPPGRAPVGESDESGRRRVSASVVKRNVVELVRDLGLEDAAFADLVAPVLREFTGSLARGEWQSCLAALAQLQSAHPGLEGERA